MKTKHWKKVSSILRDVLELEASERQKYLDSLKLNKDLRKEVEESLDLETTAENWLSSNALDLSKEIFDEEIGDKSPISQKIGIYEIKEEVGFGGMGAVYLGERIDKKFEQKVAIKMLRREFNTKRIRTYFHREREIQAKLTHPNIASLLDAGTTDDGVPYLIMEFVEGIRIDKYCKDNDLKLNKRLKLFNKVCEAVSFAHQNLVIHRDIKPSNIIITPKGEPKLLDFGISKLIDGSGETTKTLTQFGAMTPEYASPEQIKGESFTTATDIYSLGIVLYKILTGTIPYRLSDKRSANFLKEVTDSQPTMPSEAVKANSQSAIRNLKSLTGDLDNIILKAIRKEPKRRYKTVEQFSADIWRFIDGLPVKARPATFSYRAKKFFGRNKIQVIASSLIFLSLIIGISAAIWQARVASQAQKQAEKETEKAKAEQERAEKVTKFMEKVISYANPHPYSEGAKSNGEARVIDVINEMSDKIEKEFPNQPDVQAELHHKFAEVYAIRSARGEKLAAEKKIYHARRALKLRKKYYGKTHELIAKDMFYFWVAKKQNPNASAKILAEAIQMMRETNPKNVNLPHMIFAYAVRMAEIEFSREISDAYFRNAIPKPKIGRLELAEKMILEAAQLFQETGIFKMDVIISRCKAGLYQIDLGKFEEAKANFPSCKEHEKLLPKAETKNRKLYAEYAEKLEKALQK